MSALIYMPPAHAYRYFQAKEVTTIVGACIQKTYGSDRIWGEYCRLLDSLCQLTRGYSVMDAEDIALCDGIINPAGWVPPGGASPGTTPAPPGPRPPLTRPAPQPLRGNETVDEFLKRWEAYRKKDFNGCDPYEWPTFLAQARTTLRSDITIKDMRRILKTLLSPLQGKEYSFRVKRDGMMVGGTRYAGNLEVIRPQITAAGLRLYFTLSKARFENRDFKNLGVFRADLADFLTDLELADSTIRGRDTMAEYARTVREWLQEIDEVLERQAIAAREEARLRAEITKWCRIPEHRPLYEAFLTPGAEIPGATFIREAAFAQTTLSIREPQNTFPARLLAIYELRTLQDPDLRTSPDFGGLQSVAANAYIGAVSALLQMPAESAEAKIQVAALLTELRARLNLDQPVQGEQVRWWTDYQDRSSQLQTLMPLLSQEAAKP